MALIVEDGTGLATAEAYGTVVESDTYHTAHGNPVAWSGATTVAKEQAKRLAAQYMDTKYARRWNGVRTFRIQRLAHPRSGIVDDDGFSIDGSGADSITRELKDAESYLALRSIDGDTLMPDVDSPGGIIEESAALGLMKETIKYAGSKGHYKRYSIVDRLLHRLIGPVGQRVRG